MATIVCQQQSPCLDSHILVEPRTTLLRLKLSPSPTQQQPKCHVTTNTTNSSNTTCNSVTNNNNKGGWTFLQSLSTNSEPSKEPIYEHPSNKRSSKTILNEKSLQICTENLGNETGTIDTNDCGILSNNWWAMIKNDCESDTVKSSEICEMGRRRISTRRAREAPRNFPPPLTTITGKESIQVRTHREDGRLVIKAVKAQSRLVSCFRADRSEEGRLRLCFLENYLPNFGEKESERESFESDPKEEVKEEEKEEIEKNEVLKEREEMENEMVEEEEVKNESESEKVKVKAKKEGEKLDKGEIGIVEKFIGRGRCKESGDQQHIVDNKRVFNWEPFCVAT